MKKVPSIFERDWQGDKSRVLDVANPECAWVFSGEGIATRKYDGTAVLIKGDDLFARYDAKNGKTPPVNFIPAQEAADPETGHWPGWVPVGIDSQYKWHREAFNRLVMEKSGKLQDGTWEACGPHFQKNPEAFEADVLIKHGCILIEDAPRSFNELAEWFKGKDIEGIVWHHPDGRMAKIKMRDFGLKREKKTV